MPDATTTQVGVGTKLGYKLASGGSSYLPVGTLITLSPSYSVGEVENVILASTFKPYLPTLPEAEMDFTVQHIDGDPAVKALLVLLFAPAIVFWQITAPDLSTVAFQGFLKSYSPSYENESIVEADCSLRITTVPVFVDAV
jgi:hypothetical protein